MKYFYKYLCFIIIIVFSSCRQNSKEISENAFTKIGIDIDSQMDQIDLSQIFDSISIIPLQTLSECLIGEVSSVFMTKTNIYVLDKIRSTVFVFNSSGEFIFKLCNVGKGPNEYTDIFDFFVDENEKQLIVVSPEKIQQYSLDRGRFISEFEKKIFGVQYWYLGKNTYAAYSGNIVSEDCDFNLVLFNKNNIIKRHFKINDKMKDFNLSLNNSFSLKNDNNIVYFSHPFTNQSYLVDNNVLIESVKFEFSRNNIPSDFWRGYSKHNITEVFIQGGFCYGVEDFYKDNNFCFFKFRGEQKVFNCFILNDSIIKFSNSLCDDLAYLPFHGFHFGSSEKKVLISHGDIVDLKPLFDALDNQSSLDKENSLIKIPSELINIYKSNSLESNPFIVCYHY